MRMKEYRFDVKDLKNAGEGAFGTYYKISSVRGVKVLACSGYGTIAEAKRSYSWREAKKEYKLLRKAYKTNYSPKPHGLAIVKDGDKYRVGIVMQHISGKEYDDVDGPTHQKLNKRYQDGVSDFLSNKLRKVGIVHDDLHGSNIIIKKIGSRLKPYVIDFSPGNIYAARPNGTHDYE